MATSHERCPFSPLVLGFHLVFVGIHRLLEVLFCICCGTLAELNHMNQMLLLCLLMEWNSLTHNSVPSNNAVLCLDHWRMAPLHMIISYFAFEFVFAFQYHLRHNFEKLLHAKREKQTIQSDSRNSTKRLVCELSHDKHCQHIEQNERPLLYLNVCTCCMRSTNSYKSNLSN